MAAVLNESISYGLRNDVGMTEDKAGIVHSIGKLKPSVKVMS
jgi:hypothetical protein